MSTLRIYLNSESAILSGCRLQNQTGPRPKKWEKTGVVVEVRQHNQYLIRVDGSGRLTLRNRQFLRTYEPLHPKKTPFSDFRINNTDKSVPDHQNVSKPFVRITNRTAFGKNIPEADMQMQKRRDIPDISSQSPPGNINQEASQSPRRSNREKKRPSY